MASAELSNSILKSKFRGCLISVLAGDCLGDQAYFFTTESLSKFMNDLLNEEDEDILPHTDDTRMTISVASSLAEKSEVNVQDMAQKFVDDFYRERDRGYGFHVRHVFVSLKESNYEDIFSPAGLQFDGTGSWGNGAAMRIAPIALFGNSRGEEFIMD